MPVSDLSAGKVVSIAESSSLQMAATLMADESVGCLAVLRDNKRGRPVGILTDRDIVVEAVAKGLVLDSTPVSRIMSTNIVTVSEDESIAHMIRMMRENSVRRILVVDEQGLLTGLVSTDDLIRMVGQELDDIGTLFQNQLLNSTARVRPNESDAGAFI